MFVTCYQNPMSGLSAVRVLTVRSDCLQVSFVNSICTVKGGTHVNHVVDQITKCVFPSSPPAFKQPCTVSIWTADVTCMEICCQQK